MTDYEKGYSVGIDAVEGIQDRSGPESAAGLLAAVMSAVYFCAPDTQSAEAVFEIAKEQAKDDHLKAA